MEKKFLVTVVTTDFTYQGSADVCLRFAEDFEEAMAWAKAYCERLTGQQANRDNSSGVSFFAYDENSFVKATVVPVSGIKCL